MRRNYPIAADKRIFAVIKTTSAPNWMADFLKEKAAELGLTGSRIVANLLFNVAMNGYDDAIFKIELPDISDVPYVDGKYASKAGGMTRMIEKFSHGATLEDLALLYREMGFKDLEEMLMTHRELVKVGMLVEQRRKDLFTGKLKKVFVPDYLTKKQIDKKRKGLKPLEKIDTKGPLDD